MSATSILPARAQLKQLAKEEAARIKETVLSLGTAEEVVSFVKRTFSLA